MRRRTLSLAALAVLLPLLLAPGVSARSAREAAEPVVLRELTLPPGTVDVLRERWLTQLRERHGTGTWAPMRMELGDEDLALLGLPSRKVLQAHRYPVPTTFDADGNPVRLTSWTTSSANGKGNGKGGGGTGGDDGTGGPYLGTVAGAGAFGIRPGAWLLLLEDGVGWCSMAHVFGSPGSYDISTAGHCGKVGDRATAIGVVGNRTPVLLDFGRFASSTDGGLGRDWALIDIEPAFQGLVSPTMPVWGGPFGQFTATGEVVDVKFPRRSIQPDVTVGDNPFLAQQIVHYGHGTVVGAGGTPRTGSALAWGSDHFMFVGAIAPGDSGSAANTLLGDSVDAQREAAGIMTHLWIDPLMRQGIGVMGGTRVTEVNGTMANGQLVPYPAPVPGAP